MNPKNEAALCQGWKPLASLPALPNQGSPPKTDRDNYRLAGKGKDIPAQLRDVIDQLYVRRFVC